MRDEEGCAQQRSGVSAERPLLSAFHFPNFCVEMGAATRHSTLDIPRRAGKFELMNREFFVVIEKDEDGFFVGEVPQLKACYSQGKTIDELLENMKEAIALALEDQEDVEPTEFVGVQKLLLNV
jgi:predicted RNase H-like HicB family nuclease